MIFAYNILTSDNFRMEVSLVLTSFIQNVMYYSLSHPRTILI
jgi:hypothetical protein